MFEVEKMQAAACKLGIPKLCAVTDGRTEAASSDTWLSIHNALTDSEQTANG